MENTARSAAIACAPIPLTMMTGIQMLSGFHHQTMYTTSSNVDCSGGTLLSSPAVVFGILGNTRGEFVGKNAIIDGNTPISSVGSLARDLRVLGGDVKDGNVIMSLLCRQSLLLKGRRGTAVVRVGEGRSFPLRLAAEDPFAQACARDVNGVSKESISEMCRRDCHAIIVCRRSPQK